MNDSVLNLPDEPRMLDVVRSGLVAADDVRIAVSFTMCSGSARPAPIDEMLAEIRALEA